MILFSFLETKAFFNNTYITAKIITVEINMYFLNIAHPFPELKFRMYIHFLKVNIRS